LIASNGTCYGAFYGPLSGNATNFRAKATSADIVNLLTKFKSSYPGFFSSTPVAHWTSKNLPGLSVSLSLSQWACAKAKSLVTGSTGPAQPGNSAAYWVTGSGVQSSLDYQTLALLQGGDNFFNSAFGYYGFAVYYSSSNAVIVTVLASSG